MWFLEQWNPGSAAYHMPAAVRLRGTLDIAALTYSLNTVIARHDILRTTIAVLDTGPEQAIAPAAPLALETADLSDSPAASQQSQVDAFIAAFAARPFDLLQGPLVRAALLRLAPDQHLLVLTLHHLVTDGWSMGVLIGELTALYRARRTGAPDPLPPLALQYADVAAWQQEWLRSPTAAAHLEYWRAQLDPNAVLELPTGRSRPPLPSGQGARLARTLTPEQSEPLKAFCRREGKTLFALLLAAFQTLLHRYTGQTDITIGTPIAGRTRAALEGLIGPLLNTLALRTRLHGDLPLRALLGQVHQTLLDAYAHQELPFEKLVDALAPARRAERTPVFQHMLILQNAPQPPLEAPGLVLESFPVATATTKFDLTLIAVDEPAGLRLTAEYSTDLFDASTIERLLDHYLTLLAGIVAHPDMPLDALPLLPAAERAQILGWAALPVPAAAATPAPLPATAYLHTAFAAQAARTPEQTAVIDATRSMSYCELDRRSNQLAHALRRRGVGRETPVGLCAARGWELLVGLLGILKAGGTYVPLDPSHPAERLGFILADAGIHTLITQAELVAQLPPHAAAVLCLDSDWPAIAQAPDTALAAEVFADQLAYLIYTSGSTGKPKAVAIAHRNAGALLRWAARVFPADLLQGTLAATSITFDLSVFELFLPLATGGTVILAQNALALPDLAARDQVTLINTVPSAVAELLRTRGLPRSVRAVNLAGEPLPAALADTLYAQGHIVQVHDLYGPSETTTYSTFALRHPGGPATIGHPIDGTTVYVLDRRLDPVPIGVSGELYIGGDGVTRGYLGRPALTAERFLPDPFAATAGARLYRTGDRARFAPDGTLEYQGRFDFQVKIRGFRIELGEIQAVLLRHPAIAEAIVLVREDRPGDRRLVAYLIAHAASPVPTAAALRGFVAQSLPEPMVPAAFCLLPAFPRSPNGKLDLRALPPPEQSRLGTGRTFAPPRTPLEQSVARIWQDVLQLERVSIDDPFFEIGGNSMLALQAHHRLTAQLTHGLDLTELFQYPTIRTLCERLEQRERASQEDAAAPSATQSGRARAQARRALQSRRASSDPKTGR